jgi:MFS family permease
MIFGIISLLITFTVPLLVIRWFIIRRSARRDFGEEIREIFQYLATLVLLVVVNTGLSGLLANLFPAPDRLVTDENLLARNTAFVIVGAPLLLLLTRWDRKALSKDKEENEGFALQLYFVIAPITALIITSVNAYQCVITSLTDDALDGQGFATAAIWLLTLAIHYRLAKSIFTPERRQPAFLLASAISLVLLVIGLARIIASVITTLLPFSENTLVTSGPSELLRGTTLLSISIFLWSAFWFFGERAGDEGSLRSAYLLLIGIFAPLVAMLVGASIVFYQLLLWYLGDPKENSFWIHLSDIPAATGTLLSSGIAFTYHQVTLRLEHSKKRSEVNRIYEYLLSAGGLVTSAIAVSMGLVSIVESFTSQVQVLGSSATNTALLALTLFLVGVPLWIFFWRRISNRVKQEVEVELGSSTRRVYLILILGASGIGSIAALLTTVVRLFEGFFNADFGTATVRELAYPLSILLTALLVARYHLNIFRQDRLRLPKPAAGLKYLLLIGPQDLMLKKALERETGARVDFVRLADGFEGSWSQERVKTLISSNEHPELALIHDSAEYRVIPIKR